jgi:hypothetical protein
MFFGKNHKHSSRRTTVKQKGLSRRSVVAKQDRQTKANPEATRYSIPGKKKTQKSKASMGATQETTFEQNRHQFPSVNFYCTYTKADGKYIARVQVENHLPTLTEFWTKETGFGCRTKFPT